MESESHRAELVRMIEEREKGEKELAVLNDELEGYAHCRFEEPLVDKEGFPRSDIEDSPR